MKLGHHLFKKFGAFFYRQRFKRKKETTPCHSTLVIPDWKNDPIIINSHIVYFLAAAASSALAFARFSRIPW